MDMTLISFVRGVFFRCLTVNVVLLSYVSSLLISFFKDNNTLGGQDMKLPFENLKYRYGLAGAREEFENICIQLIQSIRGDNTHTVNSAGGDGGIDIFVGNYAGPLEVYQCKYFIENFNSNQKKQITDSFDKVIAEKGKNITNWYLCIARDFSKSQHEWWANWKGKMEKIHGIKIGLWDASRLEMELKRTRLFDGYFSDNDSASTDSSLFFNDFRLIISDLSENSSFYNINFLNDLEDLIRKWQAHEFIIRKNTPIFNYMNEFSGIVACNSGKLMNNPEAEENVTILINKIIEEYVKLVES